MNSNTASATARLQFKLTMELPGPSEGDACEYIESLGIDPWLFEEIKPIAEVVNGRMATGTFEAIGNFHHVLDLAAATIHHRPSANLPAGCQPVGMAHK
jgi:hypothetical protein